MKKAAIFDFDFTLGDSSKGIISCANYALQKLEKEKKSDMEIKKTIGLTLKESYFSLTADYDETQAVKFAQLFAQMADEVMVRDTNLYPEVIPVLQALKRDGYQICIVTTKRHDRIDQILQKFGITDLVDLIVGGDDVKVEKPSPEGVLWVLEHLQLEKEQVLYVGDSLVDAKTAQNAGVKFAGVLTGTTTQQDFAAFDYTFIGQNLKDIYDFLCSWV